MFSQIQICRPIIHLYKFISHYQHHIPGMGGVTILHDIIMDAVFKYFALACDENVLVK